MGLPGMLLTHQHCHQPADYGGMGLPCHFSCSFCQSWPSEGSFVSSAASGSPPPSSSPTPGLDQAPDTETTVQQ